MYSSILSNIALNGSKTQFYFPFFCHSFRLLHLAWFVFKHKLLFWSPPTQEEVGHIFVRILSATMLVLAYHSPTPFLVWMHDILWTNSWLFGHIIGIVWRVFLCFDDLDLIFKSTSYHKLSNLSQKCLSAWYFCNQSSFNNFCSQKFLTWIFHEFSSHNVLCTVYLFLLYSV